MAPALQEHKLAHSLKPHNDRVPNKAELKHTYYLRLSEGRMRSASTKTCLSDVSVISYLGL